FGAEREAAGDRAAEEHSGAGRRLRARPRRGGGARTEATGRRSRSADLLLRRRAELRPRRAVGLRPPARHPPPRPARIAGPAVRRTTDGSLRTDARGHAAAQADGVIRSPASWRSTKP